MVIKGGLVLQRKETGYTFEELDIRIRDEFITETGADLSPEEGEDMLSADGALVVPGLINSHVHSYSNLLKGTSQGEPLELWSLDTVALGGAMCAEEMALSAKLGIIEMLRCGVTSCVDHIPHAKAVDPIAQTYISAGFRAAAAPMLHDRSDHLLLKGMREVFPPEVIKRLEQGAGRTTADRIAEYRDWIERYTPCGDMLQVFVAPNSPQRCTEELLCAAGELADEFDAGIHAHLLETAWQKDTALEDGDPVAKMERAGLLNGRTSLAHCVWLTIGQGEKLREHCCTVVGNPASNLFLGSGTAPLGEYIKSGIPVAFGSDGCNCGIGHNMLEITRHGMFTQRQNGQWLSADTLWDCLLEGGARVMQLEGSLGRIAAGCRADLCIWDQNVPALMPQIDLAAQCMTGLPSPVVRHAFINGRMVMRDGKVLTIDEEETFRQLKEASPRLREKFRSAMAEAKELRPWYEKAYMARLRK